jgi:penicillin amidase
MRILKRLLLSLLLLLLCVVGATYWLATHQGRDAVRWSSFSKAKVQFDANGIPTLEAADWDSLVYAQGFVVASDRLWQMDLMRRAGAGRLAEWFGNIDKVVAFDEERRQEDWLGVADRAVADLPADERATCDAFAGGVNHFIQENTWRWGLEYLFLRTRPEPWQCRDSLLILLSMVEDLSEVFEEEAQSSAWRRFLTPSWEAFLFTSAHPWNTPQFDGAKKEPLVDFPQEKIPLQPLQPEEAANEKFDAEDFVIGSNSWIYRGQKGFFLANDPHLSHSVPQLWYPIRFQKGPQEWAVGVALPGIPALVLGRNAKVAWGFTNVKEDVDDILEEEMSEDGKQYVASVTRGKKEWKPVEERAYEIQIRDTAPRKGTAYFTHRGPVSKRPFMGESFFSRQWLGFQKGALRLPGLALMQATDWESFNQAVDRFAAPAQAVVYANVDRSFGIRVSGRGIRRKRTGLVPQPAIEGEWLGIEGPEKRFRSWVPADSKTAFLSSANQRLWKAGWGEHWSSDVRDQRIREFLGGPSELDRQQMRALQQDTRSRSMRSLLRID